MTMKASNQSSDNVNEVSQQTLQALNSPFSQSTEITAGLDKTLNH